MEFKEQDAVEDVQRRLSGVAGGLECLQSAMEHNDVDDGRLADFVWLLSNALDTQVDELGGLLAD